MASSAPYDNMIDQAAIRNGLQPDYFRGIIKRESGFDPNAVNKSSGAMGFGQVLASTAKDPGYGIAPLTNPFDPQSNIDFSAAYLAARIKQAGGNVNAGTTGYSGSEYGSGGITPIGRADGTSSLLDPFAGSGSGVPGMTTEAGPTMATSNVAPDNPEFPGVNSAGTIAPPSSIIPGVPANGPSMGPSIPSASSLHDWFRRGAIGFLALIMLAVAFVALTRKTL